MSNSSPNLENGKAAVRSTPPTPSAAPLASRRVVLLADGEASPVREVLREYHGTEVSGKCVHEELQRCAAEHPGRWVAVEWQGKLGWTRYLWCRKT